MEQNVTSNRLMLSVEFKESIPVPRQIYKSLSAHLHYLPEINSAFHLHYGDACPHHSDSSLSCLITYMRVDDILR